MSRGLNTRLERLERGTDGAAVDLEAEAAQYGELTGQFSGRRSYARQFDEYAQLAYIGGLHGPLVYQIVGMRLEDLC